MGSLQDLRFPALSVHVRASPNQKGVSCGLADKLCQRPETHFLLVMQHTALLSIAFQPRLAITLSRLNHFLISSDNLDTFQGQFSRCS